MIAAFFAVLPQPTIVQPVRPNIIYIMADDLGYRELGCFGQKKIATPNIDRLAREGVRMTRSYSASPVCAPTRYSLLTGKHQGHAAIRGNKEAGGFGPNDREGQMPIAREEVTIAELLKGAGYRTGLVGKWGLGGPEEGQFPMDHGFDFFYGYLCQRRAHNFYPAYLWKNRQPDLLDNPVYAAHQRISEPLSRDEDYEKRFGGKSYSAAKLSQACVEFLSQKSDEPFFLYYAPTLPHVALQAPAEWVNKYPQSWDSVPYLGANGYLPSLRPRATYAAMIAFLDHTVGEIINILAATGKAEETLIIFTSDNGAVGNVGGVDRTFFESNGELRAGKMSLYEGGIRVPFVARWPGRVPPGTESAHTFACYDSFATLAEVAGVRAPRSDGRSFLPAMTGKSQAAPPWLYFEYPEATVMQALIFGRHKAIRPRLRQSEDMEIYDLESDPGETRDLAASRPDLVTQASRIMKEQHRRNVSFPLGLIDAGR